MSDVKKNYIFSSEQIVVPDDFPAILKNFTKEVIRKNPDNLVGFSKQYFQAMLEDRGYFQDLRNAQEAAEQEGAAGGSEVPFERREGKLYEFYDRVEEYYAYGKSI